MKGGVCWRFTLTGGRVPLAGGYCRQGGWTDGHTSLIKLLRWSQRVSRYWWRTETVRRRLRRAFARRRLQGIRGAIYVGRGGARFRWRQGGRTRSMAWPRFCIAVSTAHQMGSGYKVSHLWNVQCALVTPSGKTGVMQCVCHCRLWCAVKFVFYVSLTPLMRIDHLIFISIIFKKPGSQCDGHDARMNNGTLMPWTTAAVDNHEQMHRIRKLLQRSE